MPFSASFPFTVTLAPLPSGIAVSRYWPVGTRSTVALLFASKLLIVSGKPSMVMLAASAFEVPLPDSASP